MGVPLMDLFSSESTEVAKAQLKRIRNEDSVEPFECEAINAAGESFDAQFSLSSTNYDGELSTQVMVRALEGAPVAEAPLQHQPEQGGSTIDAFLMHLTRACEQNAASRADLL